MTLKYGLIGAGMMGQEHIRNISLLHDVEVAAICEPNTDMANAARQLAPTAQIVPDLPNFFGIQGLDALVIASPNHMHIGQLEEIAANLPLPVLAEKPICTAPDELERVQALPAKLPHAVWVAMEYRYMPPVAELIKAAEKVTGGVQMLSIREHRFPFLPKIGDWNRFNDKTGGTMVEKCCHFFDLMRHILKDDPVRVIASAGQHVNHVDEEYDANLIFLIMGTLSLISNGVRARCWSCACSRKAQNIRKKLASLDQMGKAKLWCLVRAGPGIQMQARPRFR